MNHRHDLHLVYVLHSRAFRETSLLVEAFSRDHGRIAFVARGAKRGKAKISSILQPFAPLTISWYGNSELVTLTHVEPARIQASLYGRRAICGLYINELLIKLLHKWDPCVQLFDLYEQTLVALTQEQLPEQVTLRKFEKSLLKSIGYGLQLTVEVESGELVANDEYYLFDPTLGPRLVNRTHPAAIKGQSLLALDAEDFNSADVLNDIKQLMRMVFSYHLGARGLITRELL